MKTITEENESAWWWFYVPDNHLLSVTECTFIQNTFEDKLRCLKFAKIIVGFHDNTKRFFENVMSLSSDSTPDDINNKMTSLFHPDRFSCGVLREYYVIAKYFSDRYYKEYLVYDKDNRIRQKRYAKKYNKKLFYIDRFKADLLWFKKIIINQYKSYLKEEKLIAVDCDLTNEDE